MHPSSIRALWLVFVMVLSASTGVMGSATANAAADPRQVWQLLDYIRVDYRAAIGPGSQILSEPEYAEMREFATTAQTQIAQLPDQPDRESLLAAARTLVQAIESRREPDIVADLARQLADALLAKYPVPLAPTLPPDLVRGRQLFASHCSACHGVGGAADGPLARTLDPPPVAFTDEARARERSPFGYYQAITQGITGTSMASFAALPDLDRWALAFYAGTLAHSEIERGAGARLWRDKEELRAALPNLEALARVSEAQLASQLGDEAARPVLAYLRSDPSVVLSSSAAAPLAIARARLAESLRAYETGRAAEAQRLALAAYLDGVEPIEPLLSATRSELLGKIEAAMSRYRSALSRGSPVSELTAQARSIDDLLDAIEQAIAPDEVSATATFLGSFTILLREGVEALLIVIAILAFLGKAGRNEFIPYVHRGWIAALVAGVVTWGAATYLISISGAQRELTEGISSLFAAVVLLSVGLWMHGKSIAGRWQHYLREKLSAAMSRRSAWFLAGLAFIAVYREVFETILFYAALWTQGRHGALLTGFIVAALALAAIAYSLLRASRRLPISQFFSISSIFIGILAVVLVGKGVAALQEAGLIALDSIDGPRLTWLGVYPNVQTSLAQLTVLLLTIVGFVYNHLTGRRARSLAASR